jgi:Lon protease-like protein
MTNNKQTNLQNVPIFPLGTVLFPSGSLPLRVFENRYVDMVKECMKQDTPFGVCLVVTAKNGEKESTVAAEHERIGCLAKIVDFDMEQMGVLQILTTGLQRFEVLERWVDDTGLARANVRTIADDEAIDVPDNYSECARLTQEIVAQIKDQLDDAGNNIIAQPYQFESASWVSNRLSEVLPIAMPAKQRLMELEDPLGRLSIVHSYLQQQKVL